MTTRIITRPTALAIPLADAKRDLRIVSSAFDADVTMWIKGITAAAAEYMQRSIMPTSLRATLDSFPAEIFLDHPPIISVESVKYFDAAGVLQTLSADDYQVGMASEPARIVPATGKQWPQTADRIGAVTVDYTAGYSAIPDEIILYLRAKLVEQYAPDSKPEKDTIQASYIGGMLDLHRIY